MERRASLSESAKINGTAPGSMVSGSTVPDGTVPGATVADIMWRPPHGWPRDLSRKQRGIRTGLLALVHSAAFTCLLLAGTVLLVVTVAPVVIAGLGLEHLIQDLL